MAGYRISVRIGDETLSEGGWLLSEIWKIGRASRT